jgi:hypothetical protein
MREAITVWRMYISARISSRMSGASAGSPSGSRTTSSAISTSTEPSPRYWYSPGISRCSERMRRT